MVLRTLGVACLLTVCLTSAYAAERPFFPDRGLLFPDSVESNFTNIGHVLSNPSRIAHTETKAVVKLENSPSFVGYTQVSLAGTLPYQEWTFFAGYLHFGNTSLEHTARDPITKIPVRTGTFSHAYHYATLGTSYLIPESQVHVVGNLEWDAHHLDDEQVSGVGAGGGLHWDIGDGFWGAFYIQRAISPEWRWASGHLETLGMRTLLSTGYREDTWAISTDTDLRYWRVRGEYAAIPLLSLLGDLVSSEFQSIQRGALGVTLHLSPFSFHYTHTLFSEQNLGADQDIFGVTIGL